MKKDRTNIIIVLIFVLWLLAIAPVWYYYWYALPEQKKRELEFEREKYNDSIERERIEKEEAEQEEVLRKINLDNCLYEAEVGLYKSEWDNNCSAWKVQVDTAWDNCIKWKYDWESDEDNKNRCIRTTPDYKTDENGNCLLPSERSDWIEEKIKEKKEECYNKYTN